MDVALPFPSVTRANVECNAPLSRVPYKLEKGALGTGGFDATSVAAAEQRKFDEAVAGRQAKEEEFDQKLKARLRRARTAHLVAQQNAERLAHGAVGLGADVDRDRRRADEPLGRDVPTSCGQHGVARRGQRDRADLS